MQTTGYQTTPLQAGHQPTPLQAGHQPSPVPAASQPAAKQQAVSKQRSTDGFSAVFSSLETTATTPNPAVSPAPVISQESSPAMPSLPVAAPAVKEQPLQATQVVQPPVAIAPVQQLPPAAVAPVQEPAPVAAEPVKPPRPEDFDDYWYQDDDGSWRNEYTDQG